MKNLILSALLMGSCWANAQTNDALNKIFYTTSYVPYLAALDCPGVGHLQLKELYEWRKAGDLIDLSNSGSIDQTIAMLKARAAKVSPLSAFLIFDSQADLDRKNVAFDGGAGGFDARSVGLPVTIDGCAVVPVAIDASQLRDGPPYLIAKKAYDRLGDLDRYIFKLLIKGARPQVVRSLIDARSLTGSLEARYRLFMQRGLPTFFTGEVELELIQPKDNTNVKYDGPILREAVALMDWNDDATANISFTDNGHVRTVQRGYGTQTMAQRSVFGKNLFPTSGAGLDCNLATYRADGTMVNCDGKFYSSSGAMLNSVANPATLYSQFDIKESDLADADTGKYPDNIVLEDGYGKTRTMHILGLSRKLISYSIVQGEPSCESMQVDPQPNGTKFDIAITVPADCVALMNFVWQTPEVAKPTPPPELPKKHKLKRHRRY